MNITSWNVNSLRARLDRVLAWVDAHEPDVLCMQEVKCVDGEFPFEPFRARGYHVETFGQKTYNGVAIASRAPMSDVARGLPDAGDPQARGITARVDGVRVVNLYVPNGGDLTSDKYTYKLGWLEKLKDAVSPFCGEPLVVCGDFNIAPSDDDVYDPAGWKGQVLCSDAERERFRSLLDLGLVDAFRVFEKRPRQYTWWDYRGNMWSQNNGLRIDHHLLSPQVAARAIDVTVDLDERGRTQASDHAPVTLHLRD
ncbi:MAG: exodeoxyribonuclease III [Myxococcota bacterium]